VLTTVTVSPPLALLCSIVNHQFKENIKKRKKKLKKYKSLVAEGKMSREKADESYISWKAHVSNGNSYNTIQSMDKYYRELWEA
jgi:predicted DNA binding protein